MRVGEMRVGTEAASPERLETGRLSVAPRVALNSSKSAAHASAGRPMQIHGRSSSSWARPLRYAKLEPVVRRSRAWTSRSSALCGLVIARLSCPGTPLCIGRPPRLDAPNEAARRTEGCDVAGDADRGDADRGGSGRGDEVRGMGRGDADRGDKGRGDDSGLGDEGIGALPLPSCTFHITAQEPAY
jgi:hypothetical protein